VAPLEDFLYLVAQPRRTQGVLPAMEDNIAGTVHLHRAEKGVDEKTTVIAEHNEIVYRTATGEV
jgi:hypothetical protein